jgi:hypothetical protein
MDLFRDAVPPERLHPNFRAARDAAPEDRQVLASWSDGFVDRDGKFVIEFQTTFNSSFWELYLFACLKGLGHRVDFSYDAPDFVVSGPAAFCVEATTANSAQGALPEWLATPQGLIELEDRSAVVDEATIRLANAVSSKHQKYVRRYAQLPHVQRRPFVLAVAPFEQPHFRVQNSQAIRRVLYGYDATPYELIPGTDVDEIVITGGEFFDVPSARKASGVEIPLGVFRDGQMAGISAVVFSSTATWGKVRAVSADPNPHVWIEFLRYNALGPHPIHGCLPKDGYHEPLLDGLCVFHNPFADYPLPWDVFDSLGVVQETWDPDDNQPRVVAAHGTLIQRTVITLQARSDEWFEAQRREEDQAGQVD